MAPALRRKSNNRSYCSIALWCRTAILRLTVARLTWTVEDSGLLAELLARADEEDQKRRDFVTAPHSHGSSRHALRPRVATARKNRISVAVHPLVYPSSENGCHVNAQNHHKLLILLARPKRFELLTPRFVVCCSISNQKLLTKAAVTACNWRAFSRRTAA